MEKLSERLPEAFQNQMKELLGEDYKKYIDALNADSVRGLRVNKVKTSVDDFLKTSEISKKLTRLGFTDDGFILDDEDKIGNTAEHLTGQIYIQEPSSMVPVCASGIEKEEEPKEEPKNEVENTVVNEVVNNTVNEIDGNELTKMTEEIGVIPEVGNNIMVNFLFSSIIVSIIMIVIVKKPICMI